ncbi:MAG: GNAT family N-acetyltransferase [Alcaligenaceae bacterium]|nr:GNAT family N-acetyltransferase [Alcaligenaceae bacterium]
MSPSFSLSRPQDINAEQWDRLAGGQPFLRHRFLLALDETGCATPRTGWTPRFLLMHDGPELAGAMPLYLKAHSRGEYVFDYAWAEAYERHGLRYYPKLLCAVPFTPVPGPRLLARTHEARVALARGAIEFCRLNGISSLHVLFPAEEDGRALAEAGFLFRHSVQFHWFNRNYACMEDFLKSLNQKNRKKIRQDGKKSEAAGVRFRFLSGGGIDDDSLRFFYRCYRQTYLEHGHLPYLNSEFFFRLRSEMADDMVIVLALQHDEPIAAALNLRDGDTLYGRYWGSTRYVPGLHFETCYMQGIAYCIQEGLSVFQGGAQGEHKLARGLLPVETCSAHWVADGRFAEAIREYLERETPALRGYAEELRGHSPYRKDETAAPTSSYPSAD